MLTANLTEGLLAFGLAPHKLHLAAYAVSGAAWSHSYTDLLKTVGLHVASTLLEGLEQD